MMHILNSVGSHHSSLASLVGFSTDYMINGQDLANLILLVDNRLGDNLVSLILHSFGLLLLWFAAKGWIGFFSTKCEHQIW